MRLEGPCHSCLTPPMLLAGDVGGTKTLLGIFVPEAPRPVLLEVRSYPSQSFDSFIEILDAFESDTAHRLSPASAAFGVAGPVIGAHAHLTNIGWNIDAEAIARRLSTPRVALMNDLEAMATGVTVLTADELEPLQVGMPREGGNAVVIAAGTGLGQAYLHRVGDRLQPVASEGGHADFAARTDRELELVRMLRDMYGRAEVEQVLSGPGLVNLHRFTHRGGECEIVTDLDSPDAPAAVSRAGLGGRCQGCAEALRMFVSAYGAEAGNLALRGLALGGIYVGGGIAPKIMPA